MSDNTISWLEKYRPNTLADYYISKKQLDIVKNWIKDFRNSIDEAKTFLILHGSAGIGKTTLAYLILQYYNYEIIECNASDARSKKNIRDSLGQISKITVCMDDKNKFKKVAIIMDEIDGLAGGEFNAVQELIDIVTKDKDSNTSVALCPVVCTTNSIKDKKLQPLLKQGIVLNISKPSQADCAKLISKIADTENFVVPIHITLDIIEKAYGDYRQVIMLLFSYYHSLKIISLNIKTETNNTETNNTKSNNTETNNTESKYAETQYDYDNEPEHYDIIKKISTSCETPLDKINYFLTNIARIEDICYMCSADSNLYFMNFYINIIPIVAALQHKLGDKSTKKGLLIYYKFLHILYEAIKNADLMNNAIFLDKNWEILEYFDYIHLVLYNLILA